MRRGWISVRRLFLVAALLLCWTPAEADFLDDLFGGSNSDTPSTALRKSRRRVAGTSASERETRSRPHFLHSEIHFLSFRTERHEERTSTLHRGRVSRENLPQISTGNETPHRFPRHEANASRGAVAGGKPEEPSFCKTEGSDPASASPFLYDKTLRSGDIVVTGEGIQIFRGQKACPHGPDSFVALTSAVIPRSRRNVLLAIESAMHRPDSFVITAKNGN